MTSDTILLVIYILFLILTFAMSVVFVWGWSVNANHWRWDEKGYESPWHIVIALSVPSVIYSCVLYFIHLA